MDVGSPSSPNTYSAKEEITYEGMRKVHGGNGSGTPDGLAPYAVATYDFFAEDMKTILDPNASNSEYFQALSSFLFKPVKLLDKAGDVAGAARDAGKAVDTADDVKDTEKAIDNASKVKAVNNVDEVIFKQSSLDKAFTKHKNDFGSYPDGSKSSVELFRKDISQLINTGIQKQGKYRSFEGTHIYNASTRQWTFINSDGTLNTAFKLSETQFKYLLETGVVK
jgi:hypothetical protein